MSLKMSNYAEHCLKIYVKMKTTFQVQIRFEIYLSQILVYYYYYNEECFDLIRTITDLYKYLQKHNLHLNWIMLELTILLDLTIVKFILTVQLNV